MAPGHAVNLSLRLFFAPILYIALLMAIDPAAFVRYVEALSSELRMFEHRLHGFERQRRDYEPDPVEVSGRAGNVIRVIGIIVTAWAFLILAGIVN